jgi:hypothetical protein
LRKQVKASDSSDAGRHQNTKAQKAPMEYLLLDKVDNAGMFNRRFESPLKS